MKKLRSLLCVFLLSSSAVLFGSLQASANDFNKWKLDTTQDVITDEKVVTASVVAPEGLQLLIQCSPESFGAVVFPLTPRVSYNFMTMESFTEASWRIDSHPAVTSQWMVSPGGPGEDYAIVSGGDEIKSMASGLLKASERFVLRVHGVTGIFGIENAADKVKATMDACGIEAL